MNVTETLDYETFYRKNMNWIRSCQRGICPNLRYELYETWEFIFVHSLPGIMNNYDKTGSASFSTYIYSCLKNCYKRVIRDYKTKKRYIPGMEHVEFDENMHSKLEDTNLINSIHRSNIVGSKSDRVQKAFKLINEGYEFREVAGLTGMSVGMVHRRYKDLIYELNS